jgi:hypothetical protein
VGARTIPDGAAVTNHFSISFGPWVVELNCTSVSGLSDEVEVVDGPDGRGYATGKVTRRDLTIVVPDHDPQISQMIAWKEATENGAANHFCTGTVTRMDAADNPVAIYEVEHAMCKSEAPNDMSLDGAEVGQTTFMVSYFRAKRIGP